MAALLLLLLSVPAYAELPQARLDRILPLSASAGTSTTLELQGRDLDEVKTLHIDHPGIKGEPLGKPNEFRLTIGPDVPTGTYEIRTVGKYGISNSRLFSVSRGLSEVKEVEPNDTVDKAQPVPFNASVNGKSDGNGDDYYRFLVRKGTRFIVEAQALRLDSTMRASLALLDPDGKQVAMSRAYYDRTDPLLDLVAERDGEYTLSIHDATYTGDLPYRLLITDRPHVESAFPPAVVAGETAELTVYGRNLPGGKPSAWSIPPAPPLDEVAATLSAPREPARLFGFLMERPLPSPSNNARALQVRLPGLEDALNPVTLLLTPHPVVREREPNDSAASAQAITTPAVICGRFDRRGDNDWYTIKAKAGERLAIDLYCERIDLPGDPRVILLNEKNEEQVNADDHGINFNALSLNNRDPFALYNVPADGTYRLLVQESYGNGGARFLYAFRIGKVEPDFYPVAFHETNQEPTSPLVRAGGSALLQFCVNRRDGFEGPLTIEAVGLPPGLSCPTVHVSPQTEFADIVFTAAADAPEWTGTVRLKAKATIDGKVVEREVRASQRRWAIGNVSTARASRDHALAIRAKAPYGLAAPSAPVAVKAGQSAQVTVTATRHWPDFKEKIQVNGFNLPPGFTVAPADVPAGAATATLKLDVAGNVPPGTYTLVLRGDAQVPFSTDPKATSKPNVRVADPCTPVLVNVTK